MPIVRPEAVARRVAPASRSQRRCGGIWSLGKGSRGHRCDAGLFGEFGAGGHHLGGVQAPLGMAVLGEERRDGVGDLLRILRVEVVTRVLDHLVAAQPSWWQTNDRGGLSLRVPVVRIIAAHYHQRRAPDVRQLRGGLLWQFATVLSLWP